MHLAVITLWFLMACMAAGFYSLHRKLNQLIDIMKPDDKLRNEFKKYGINREKHTLLDCLKIHADKEKEVFLKEHGVSRKVYCMIDDLKPDIDPIYQYSFIKIPKINDGVEREWKLFGTGYRCISSNATKQNKVAPVIEKFNM